jgi:hypothetical protein
VWGVHVRLMTMGMMSTSVPDQCGRSASTMGLYLSMRWWDGVLQVFVRALCALSNLNFTYNEGVLAAGEGMTYKAAC